MGNAYQRVAVGTDGSQESLGAVDRAAALAADADAGLLIICAYRPDDRADTTSDASRPGAIRPPGTEQSEKSLNDDSAFLVVGVNPAEEVLDRAQQRAAALGPADIETLAVQGEPSERVIEAARSHDADVVVVGNRGLNSISGRFLGSVPQTISRHFPGDVLIVSTT